MLCYSSSFTLQDFKLLRYLAMLIYGIWALYGKLQVIRKNGCCSSSTINHHPECAYCVCHGVYYSHRWTNWSSRMGIVFVPLSLLRVIIWQTYTFILTTPCPLLFILCCCSYGQGIHCCTFFVSGLIMEPHWKPNMWVGGANNLPSLIVFLPHLLLLLWQYYMFGVGIYVHLLMFQVTPLFLFSDI